MGDVISIGSRIQAKNAAQGAAGEMVCECQQGKEPSGWEVFIQSDRAGDFVTGIACRGCGWGYHVNGGRLDDGREEV